MITRKRKLAVLERQKLKCASCGRTITLDAHRLRDWKKIIGHYPDKSVPSQAKIHHKNRRATGGSDSLHNLVALCGRCHAKAHGCYKNYKFLEETQGEKQ